MGDDPLDGTTEIASITIRKLFDDSADGGVAIFTQWSDDLGLADALGMLSFAEHTFARRILGDDD